MTKILLINPGHTYYTRAFRQSDHGSVGLPLGLLYVAAAAEKKGCTVEVLDTLVSEHTAIVKNKESLFCGISPDKLCNIVQKARPDIVGITSQFTAQEDDVVRTAELVKTFDPSLLLVVGGANISSRYSHLLKNRHIDIAVRSEAEETISEIIDHFRGEKPLREIKGIAFWNGDNIVETGRRPNIRELDSVGLPAYHLLDMEKYLNLYKSGIFTRDRDVGRNISMITSRGCPYSCVFCSVSQSMGKKWRPHTAEFIINHIKHLAQIYRVRHIHFEDDNLLLDIHRFDLILDALAREEITWDTPNGIRVDLSIDENMLKKMRLAGCKSLTIGVESGNQEILDTVVRKKIRLDHVEEFAKRCKEVGLPLRAFFVLGFPGETLKNMQETMDFALHLLKRYDVEIINLIATPLFGTPLYDIARKNRYLTEEITPRALSESTVSDGRCLISTETFSARDVEKFSKRLTAMVYRGMMLKGMRHPIASLRRVGNPYILKRTLRRMFF